MYLYDDIDQAMLADRAAEFRAQSARRLAGEITEEQFKPVRLMNGLYLQLHAYMLRIAIPYGTLSVRQLRQLAHIARTYDKGYGHFTTRTNLQLHWIKLRDMPDILDALAEVDLHGMQTSGNCVRARSNWECMSRAWSRFPSTAKHPLLRKAFKMPSRLERCASAQGP